MTNWTVKLWPSFSSVKSTPILMLENLIAVLVRDFNLRIESSHDVLLQAYLLLRPCFGKSWRLTALYFDIEGAQLFLFWQGHFDEENVNL